MARPRTKLTPGVEAEMRARTARGESAKTIHFAIPGSPSISTIERLQDTWRSSAPTEVKMKVETPDVPENVPENTPIEDLNRWLAILNRAAATAEADGNLAALASIAAKVATLMALKHRATPLPKPDPNENPDMRALAAWGEKELLKRVQNLFASEG